MTFILDARQWPLLSNDLANKYVSTATSGYKGKERYCMCFPCQESVSIEGLLEMSVRRDYLV